MHMSTSIRLSEETKAKLDRLKRDDETFDEMLERLLGSAEPVEVGAWDEETAEAARRAVDRSRESSRR